MTPGFLVRLGGPPLPRRLAPPAEPRFQAVVLPGAHRDRIQTGQRGSLTAAADLRLDNRDALRSELAVSEAGDLGLLLAGYDRWGGEVVDHLDGPFAYVLWDADSGRASFARDRLGLRPLYRADWKGGVLLASSLPLIQQLVPRAVCLDAAQDYLVGRDRQPGKTMTERVERVAPAVQGTAWVEGERATVTTHRYWSLGPAGTRAAISDSEAEAAFRDAFDRSVLACLDGSTGALLSGGLDSSSIVATARELRPGRPLPTFSIVYDDPKADERLHLDAVAGYAGVDPLRVQGETLSMLTGLDDDLRAIGEPFPTPNLFAARVLYARAAADGLDAVLDGFAGDNVVGHGDRWLTELALHLRWPTFARELRAAAARSPQPRRAAWTMLRHYALAPLVRPFRTPDPPVHFMRRELADGVAPREPQHIRDGDLHRAELSGTALPRAFEVTYARASALGIEPRFPFADRALVELCLALPPRQRVRDGFTRSILRRAMGRRLPDSLRSRSGKARLGDNFKHALFEREPERLRALVFEDVPAASDVLDVEAVQDAYRRGQNSDEERGRVALPLWRAVSFARWRSLSDQTADAERQPGEAASDPPAAGPALS